MQTDTAKSFLHRMLQASIVTALLACAAPATADSASQPPADALRSGQVLSHTDRDIYTFIEAVDGQGRVFWVAAPRCSAQAGDRIVVLAGEHHAALQSELLGRELLDFYGAGRVELNGAPLAFPAHH